MPAFVVTALDPRIAEEVRLTRRSPGYGHPVAAEIATGTGPCRSCLTAFTVGADERLLFTYRPRGGPESVGAPGPVFIHARACERFREPGFPPGLEGFPLRVEAHTNDGRVLRTESVPGTEAGPLIESLLEDPDAAFAFLRHGEAGCHIARADRTRGLRPGVPGRVTGG